MENKHRSPERHHQGKIKSLASMFATLAFASCNFPLCNNKQVEARTPTPLIPQTATLEPTFTSTPTEVIPTTIPLSTPTPFPTSTEQVPNRNTAYKNEEVDLPEFAISGVPNSVKSSEIIHWTANETEEGQTAKGDVVHRNTIGLNTEGFLAEPGVRTVDSAAEEDDAAWSTTHSDVQKVFEQPGPSYWGIPEGGFVMLTAAGMELTFQGPNGEINVKLEPKENHAWFVIIRGSSRDYKTPQDRNSQLKIEDYNPSFTMATRLPPGQYVSENYFEQNSDAATKKSCGMDGCKEKTTIFIDKETGAFTVIEQVLNQPWIQLATNIK